ncbi:MAG: BACON domain-containing carbohydrate-binding protein [Bacteroides sp.]|nr:BACON domain-containing carbohydrate-binding protein [Bacteroides sp.]
MKKKCYIIGLLGLLLAGSLGLTACGDDDLISVDLRFEESGSYTLDDEYVIDSEGATTLSIRVRSDHAWSVTGSDPDWYTISPSSGEANVETTVTITCLENTSLDDRSDSISISSEHWTGKVFNLKQEGIAYLQVVDSEQTEVSATEWEKNEITASFLVLSNQSWSAEVTEGSDWLSIEDGTSGGENYEERSETLTLAFSVNKGEARDAVLTVYDRNKSTETQVQVSCTQEGIVLTPLLTDDDAYGYVKYGYSRIEDADACTVTYYVESDTEWQVAKEDEDDDWFTIDGGTEYSGSGTITLSLAANTGTVVREASLIVSAIGSEVPIEKTITFKQAYEPETETTQLNSSGISAWSVLSGSVGADGTFASSATIISKGDYSAGTFRLTVTSHNNSIPYLELVYEDPPVDQTHTVSVKLNSSNADSDPNKPLMFTTPWGFARPAEGYFTGTLPDIKSGTNVIAMELTPSDRTDSDGEEKTEFTKIVWKCNDETLMAYYADDINGSYKDEYCGEYCYTGYLSGTTRCYIQYYSANLTVNIGTTEGSAVMEKFEYTPNVDWDDD